MFKKRTQKQTPRMRNPRIQSQTNKVFSYYNVRRPSEAEDAEQAPSARQNRGEAKAKVTRSLLIRRIAAGGVFLVLVLAVAANMRLQPSDTNVILRGTPEERLLLQDKAVYKAGAEKIMGEKLQNRTKLTFNVKNFSHAMAAKYPEIAHVNMSLPLFGGAATMYVEPSPAALLFVAQDKKAYIVDKDGKIISEGMRNVPQGIPSVLDESGLAPRIGTQVLPASDVTAIQSILWQLREKGIAVESLTLPKAAQRLEVRIQGKPYYIKFNLHENILQQIGAYLAIQQKFDREGTQPREYIDVRVGDRVYIK